MEIYLVGGAVRDQLLGLPVKERDFVVVGATEKEMLDLGYQKVGSGFPVFLHPKTKEEYALARTERKTGKGYKQFACYASPDVTLEEDLQRRDLTINAMAQTKEGNLIDPFGGVADLKNKILRHVSPAFVEDPVRVLRVARFAAKFSDFAVHPSTIELMQQILAAGELDALVPERVWNELARALGEPNPSRFFEVLAACHALSKLFPEIAATFEQVIPPLKWASQLILPVDYKIPEIRFAALLGNLAIKDINAICRRYRAPRKFNNLAKLVSQDQEHYYSLAKAQNTEILDFFNALDAFRDLKRMQQFIASAEAIIATRNINSKKVEEETFSLKQAHDISKLIQAFPVFIDDHRSHAKSKELDAILPHYPRISRLLHAYKAAKRTDIKQLIVHNPNLKGEGLKEAIYTAQLKNIESL